MVLGGVSYGGVYDARGNVSAVSDHLGHTTTFTDDVSNNRTSRENPLGQKGTFAYDSHGKLLTSTDAAGRVTTMTYDERTNLRSITDPARRTTRFDRDCFSGDVTAVTDALGRTTNLQYDGVGQLTQMINALGEVTRFAYDGVGNSKAVTPPGRPTHGFEYSPAGLETAYAPPLLAGTPEVRTFFTYDAAGRLTEIRRPDGLNVDRSHDAAGRLISQRFPAAFSQAAGTRVVAYTYDDEDKLLTATAADGGIVTNTYELSRLASATWTGQIAGSVGRTYDAAGRLQTQSVNGSGTVAFGYDDANRLTAAGQLTISHDPLDGRPTGSTLGAVTDTLAYSPAGDLTGYTASTNATPVLDLQYTRDGLGRIGSKIETLTDPNNQPPNSVTTFDYTYDAAGRLTDVSQNGTPTSQYAYDANGNRLSGFDRRCRTSTLATYDDQDRLLEYACDGVTTRYGYTPNGELSSQSLTTNNQQLTTSYSYDVLGNLVSVTLPDGTQIEYVVDALTRRIGKKVNGSLQQGFLYDGQLRVVAEIDAAGAIVSRFVYAEKVNVPEYMIKNGATYRIITDHLGSPRFVIDTASGAIIQEIEYDEFGVVLADSNPGFQPFGFAGGLYDQDTGLVRFGVRDYDARTGRWTAKDPIGFGGRSANLYGYVLNDPINAFDPSGLLEYKAEGLLSGFSLSGILTNPASRSVALAVLDRSLDTVAANVCPGRVADVINAIQFGAATLSAFDATRFAFGSIGILVSGSLPQADTFIHGFLVFAHTGAVVLSVSEGYSAAANYSQIGQITCERQQ